MKINARFTAVFEKEETGYIAYVEEMPGVNTQGETLEEAKINLEDAFSLMIDTQRFLKEEELKNKSVIREIVEFV